MRDKSVQRMKLRHIYRMKI